MKKQFQLMILIFILVTVFFTLRFLTLNQVKKTQQSSITNKAVYDEPLDNIDADSEQIKNLNQSQDPILTNHIFHTFKSGQILSLSIPADQIASVSALLRGGTKGLQLASDDFYITIFHVLKLDNSKEMCNNLSKVNMHKDLIIISQKKLNTNKAIAKVWELKNQNGNAIDQVNACYTDGTTKAWIMDIYFPVKIYNSKYKITGDKIVDSFSFSK
jgi:hypothetical protein